MRLPVRTTALLLLALAGLGRLSAGQDLTFVVTTDSQPANAREVGYLDKGVVEAIRRLATGPGAPAFGVTLGDIVYDRPALMGPVKASFLRTGLPWHFMPGNHDLDLGVAGDTGSTASYEAVFGEPSHAFHAGNALFLALDDVRHLGGPRFVGGLTEAQFALIEGHLKAEAPDQWVVLMMHIPLFDPDAPLPPTFRKADRERLFRLLAGHRHVLVLSGHTHIQRHVFHGAADGWTGPEPIHEFNVAAACGGYWSGPVGPAGVPESRMTDGVPAGYAVVTLGAETATCDYVPTVGSPDHQIALHVPASVPKGAGFLPFFANVFNGHEGWSVRATIDGRPSTAMRPSLGWDPVYAEAYLQQDADPVPRAGVRMPNPSICHHLWMDILPPDLAVGSHVVRVEATGPEGKTYRAETGFRVAGYQ